MDGLTLFGLASVTAMLVFYAVEDRSTSYILAFAAACGFASAYGFLQGALAVRRCRSDMGWGRGSSLASKIALSQGGRAAHSRPLQLLAQRTSSGPST